MLYISHTRQNTHVALGLHERLSKFGVQTWLDTTNLGSGDNWVPAIKRAIKTADSFLFVLGPSGMRDELQRLELQQVAEGEYYQDPNTAVIAAVIGKPELPGFLASRMIVRIDDSPESIAEAAVKIALALRDPASTFDEKKLKRGKEERNSFYQGILQESMDALKRSS